MADILAAVLDTLKIMGVMGIVLFLLATVNTVCSTIYNVSDKNEKFSIKKLFKGIGKTGVFYASSILVAIAFTIIPFINSIVSSVFGQTLISEDLLHDVSGVGVLGVCIGVVINQGKKAYEGIKKLGNMSCGEGQEE